MLPVEKKTKTKQNKKVAALLLLFSLRYTMALEKPSTQPWMQNRQGLNFI